jgi:hypothetical protein
MALLMGDENDNKGMILSEILLAGAIISFALASVVIVIGGIQSMLINAQNGFEAQLLAREEISLAHTATFENITSFQKIDGIFTVDFSAKYRNAFSLNISVDVSWQEGSFQKHRILTDQIVDWKRAAGAIDCDWLDEAKGNLSAVNFRALNVDDGNPITDVAALGNFVYISADGATSSLPDLYVIDVHDIQNPKVVGHLNTGPGIASIAAAGQYIFAANAGSYQMQIIDVTDPTNPFLISQAKLPGAVISGSSGFGQSVHFSDNKMYIGLIKNAGPEFYIIDVSNPQLPIALGSYEIGSTVNDIDVQGDQAVIVTPGQTSVFWLDISNPASISEITSDSFIGWQTQGAKSIAILGSQIIVGRTLGGFYSPYPELMILNKNNLLSATSSLKLDASIENVAGFNNYLYLATNDSNRAFQILRNDSISNASSSPVVVMIAALVSRGVALTCNQKAMYVVTQNDQDFFHIFALP